jgi:hypothetical protein
MTNSSWAEVLELSRIHLHLPDPLSFLDAPKYPVGTLHGEVSLQTKALTRLGANTIRDSF